MTRKMFLIAFCAALIGCRSASEPKNVQISLFAESVCAIARESHSTLAETAARLRTLGVTGFDENYKSRRIGDLVSAGLTPCNLYGFIRFRAPDAEREADAFVATAVKWGVPRIMCIPDDFTQGGDEKTEFDAVLRGMRSLVEKASRAGVTVTIEDFGGVRNPCSQTRFLTRLLDETPGLGFALDSGNLCYAGRGENILDLAERVLAEGRLRHVHLKDLSKANNHAYVTLGEGIVPNEEVVARVKESGYDGWWTLENPVGPDRLADVARQADLLRRWLSQ